MTEAEAKSTMEDDSNDGEIKSDDENAVIRTTIPFSSEFVAGQIYRSDDILWNDARWFLVVRLNASGQGIDLFLGVLNEDLPDNWHVTVQFVFILHSDDHKNNMSSTVFLHTYKKIRDGSKEYDYGRCGAIPYSLRNPTVAIHDGYLTNDRTFSISCVMKIILTPSMRRWNYNSKLETGMVGLQNLGATCYLNALLQMLHHINEFRRAVYTLPHVEETFSSSTTLALQSVFSRLQTNDSAVTTKDLTRAFGWNSQEAFMQQDVQEMMRVLLDKLEEKMKGTSASGVIKELFSGQIKSFVKCVNVTFESAREEVFYDIQLDVKNCSNIIESFQKYVLKETLDGDNMYDAGPLYGKQVAEKGLIFTKLPQVLTIHLKRFEFDLQRMALAKIHDRFEFPLRLDMRDFLATPPTESTEASASSSSSTFILHSVLVHAGEVYGGHYYAYIRPSRASAVAVAGTEDSSSFWSLSAVSLEGQEGHGGDWFKYDDEQVYQVAEREAVQGCFGRNSGQSGTSSAYMLVYVRDDVGDRIMRHVYDEEIPAALTERLDDETRKQMLEIYYRHVEQAKISIGYFTDEDILHFHNYSRSQHLVNCHRTIDIVKGTSYFGVLLEIADQLNVKPCDINLWLYVTNPDGQYQRFDGLVHYDLFTTTAKSSLGCYVQILTETNFYNESHPLRNSANRTRNSLKFDKDWSVIKKMEADWLHNVKEIFYRNNKELLKSNELLQNFDVTQGLGIGKGLSLLKFFAPKEKERLIQALGEINNHAMNCLQTFIENCSKIGAGESLIFLKVFDIERRFPQLPTPIASTSTTQDSMDVALPSGKGEGVGEGEEIPLRYAGAALLDFNNYVDSLSNALRTALYTVYDNNDQILSSWNEVDLLIMKDFETFIPLSFSNSEASEGVNELCNGDVICLQKMTRKSSVTKSLSGCTGAAGCEEEAEAGGGAGKQQQLEEDGNGSDCEVEQPPQQQHNARLPSALLSNQFPESDNIAIKEGEELEAQEQGEGDDASIASDVSEASDSSEGGYESDEETNIIKSLQDDQSTVQGYMRYICQRRVFTLRPCSDRDVRIRQNILTLRAALSDVADPEEPSPDIQEIELRGDMSMRVVLRLVARALGLPNIANLLLKAKLVQRSTLPIEIARHRDIVLSKALLSATATDLYYQLVPFSRDPVAGGDGASKLGGGGGRLSTGNVMGGTLPLLHDTECNTRMLDVVIADRRIRRMRKTFLQRFLPYLVAGEQPLPSGRDTKNDDNAITKLLQNKKNMAFQEAQSLARRLLLSDYDTVFDETTTTTGSGDGVVASPALGLGLGLGDENCTPKRRRIVASAFPEMDMEVDSECKSFDEDKDDNTADASTAAMMSEDDSGYPQPQPCSTLPADYQFVSPEFLDLYHVYLTSPPAASIDDVIKQLYSNIGFSTGDALSSSVTETGHRELGSAPVDYTVAVNDIASAVERNGLALHDHKDREDVPESELKGGGRRYQSPAVAPAASLTTTAATNSSNMNRLLSHQSSFNVHIPGGDGDGGEEVGGLLLYCLKNGRPELYLKPEQCISCIPHSWMENSYVSSLKPTLGLQYLSEEDEAWMRGNKVVAGVRSMMIEVFFYTVANNGSYRTVCGADYCSFYSYLRQDDSQASLLARISRVSDQVPMPVPVKVMEDGTTTTASTAVELSAVRDGHFITIPPEARCDDSLSDNTSTNNTITTKDSQNTLWNIFSEHFPVSSQRNLASAAMTGVKIPALGIRCTQTTTSAIRPSVSAPVEGSVKSKSTEGAMIPYTNRSSRHGSAGITIRG